mmetsp:Transcript_40966/g.63943  ORF Transcript_40966/g.63943 Transcript_40966/m.63943 type:complete len:330 (-) Transcript_40966:2507-3496(-)
MSTHKFIFLFDIFGNEKKGRKEFLNFLVFSSLISWKTLSCQLSSQISLFTSISKGGGQISHFSGSKKYLIQGYIRLLKTLRVPKKKRNFQKGIIKAINILKSSSSSQKHGNLYIFSDHNGRIFSYHFLASIIIDGGIRLQFFTINKLSFPEESIFKITKGIIYTLSEKNFRLEQNLAFNKIMLETSLIKKFCYRISCIQNRLCWRLFSIPSGANPKPISVNFCLKCKTNFNCYIPERCSYCNIWAKDNFFPNNYSSYNSNLSIKRKIMQKNFARLKKRCTKYTYSNFLIKNEKKIDSLLTILEVIPGDYFQTIRFSRGPAKQIILTKVL